MVVLLSSQIHRLISHSLCDILKVRLPKAIKSQYVISFRPILCKEACLQEIDIPGVCIHRHLEHVVLIVVSGVVLG